MKFDKITHTKRKELKLDADQNVKHPHTRSFEEEPEEVRSKAIPDHESQPKERRKLRNEDGNILLQPFSDVEEHIRHKNKWHAKGYRKSSIPMLQPQRRSSSPSRHVSPSNGRRILST